MQVQPLPFIIYAGRKYWLQKSGRYYSDGMHGKIKKERLLHRVIWRDHFGDIPKGICVHHKDGNWQNNEIDNLELIGKGEHTRMHMVQAFKDPALRVRMLAGLEKARLAAPEWHSSKEGLAWHSQQGVDSWKNRIKTKSQCKCGKTFESYSREFCSKACWQRYRRSKKPRKD